MQVGIPGWIKGLLSSRKAWLAIIAVALPIVNKKFNLEMTPDQVLAGMGTIASLILAIAGEDAAGKWGSAREIAGAVQEAAKPPVQGAGDARVTSDPTKPS